MKIIEIPFISMQCFRVVMIGHVYIFRLLEVKPSWLPFVKVALRSMRKLCQRREWLGQCL